MKLDKHGGNKLNQEYPIKNLNFIFTLTNLILLGIFVLSLNVAHASRVNPGRIQIAEYWKAVNNFRTECGRLPTESEGLDALVKIPPDCVTKAQGKFIKFVSKDRWGNKIQYISDGKSFEVKSYGKDGKPGGEGEDQDISSLSFISDAAVKLPIQKIWTHEKYSDPNDQHLKFVRLAPDNFRLLLSNFDHEGYALRMWRADINNDGQLEYIFVRSPRLMKDGTSDRRLLDKIGPIYTVENGKKTEVELPPFPVEYTNLLLPFLEYGDDGLQMSLHYAVAIDQKGNVKAIANEATSVKKSTLPGTFYLSRRVNLIWKGNSIKKLNEQFVCDEKACTKKQVEIVKRAVLPRVD